MEEEKPQVAPAERSDGGDQAEIRGEPVEIHPPHQAARSVREFLIQLGTITAGVLIALSLEGLVEWNHYRGLVTEAKATIAREIADNKKESTAFSPSRATAARNWRPRFDSPTRC